MEYQGHPNRSAPEVWRTTRYTVVSGGDYQTYEEASQVAYGRKIYANQEYIGDEDLKDRTRVVLC